MAIWQFTFHLFPREVVEQLHVRVDRRAFDANLNAPNYWAGRSPRSHAATAEALLPPRKSWSPDAFMFGDEQGDCIELWDDGITVRLDTRQFNEPLARAIVSFAAANELGLVLSQTGRSLPAEYDELIREIAQSQAVRFVLDPDETLRMIGRDYK